MNIKALLVQGLVAIVAVYIYNTFISPKIGTPVA